MTIAQLELNAKLEMNQICLVGQRGISDKAVKRERAMFIVRQAAEVLKKIKSQSSHKLYLSSLSVHVESSVVVNVSPGLEIRK